MNLARLGEAGLIDAIRRRFGRLAPPAPGGIGDDAAIVRGGRAWLLASSDCLIEGRHFRRDEPAFLLGRKSLSVNLSDIAAMGGLPASFLLSLGIPDGLPPRFLDRLLDGLVSCARDHAVTLIGGDISGSPGPLVVSITVLGRAGRGRMGRALTRAGARPGDGIYVSGPLGGSAAGRLLLSRGWRPKLDRGGRRVVGARPRRWPAAARGRAARIRTRALEALRLHLDPIPRLALGRGLLERRIASAAIDLSDGLSTDLWRLTVASRVGARLLGPAVPIADAARALGPLLGADPLGLALDGGEDYELLFTVPPARERLLGGFDALFIGRITSRSCGLTVAGPAGRERPLRPAGFDHLSA